MDINNSSSDAYHLRKIDWDYFITLTWRKIPPKDVRKRILYEYIRRLGGKFKCKNSKHKKFKHTYLWDLTWAVCFELGSITSRPHMHMLMKLNDCSTNQISQQSILKRTWEKDVGKGKGTVGLADVCSYDHTLNGAGYIVKNSTCRVKKWCAGTGLNRRPTGCKPVALPLSYPRSTRIHSLFF